MSNQDVVLDGNVERFIGKPHPFQIGGEWVKARSGDFFETNDPATGWGRATGRMGAELYTEVKSVWVNLN
jgi:hypothetical protein